MEPNESTNNSALKIEQLSVTVEQERTLIQDLQTEIAKKIIGQKYMISRLLIALLTEGHILLEGVPGLAKTLAIKTLSSIVDAQFSRIQFTPDLLPADITGTVIYSPKNENFSIKRGPLFSNFILADEINRAPAKVQSALLEAMQEKQITIGDETYKLPSPFLVMATQNPIDQEGTYHLPEAQMDRFMLKVNLTYPTPEEELKLLHQQINKNNEEQIKPICHTSDILRLQSICKTIYIDPKIEKYIVDIVYATRIPEKYGLENLKNIIETGASPRATINIAKAAQALALIRNRAYVIPDDVKAVANDILNHRISVSFEGEAEQIKPKHIITTILNKIEVP